MIENPFESGHIKNYILAYVSVVVIMVLFFIASSLFNDVKVYDTKEFKSVPHEKTLKPKEQKQQSNKYKLLKENVY